MSHAVKLAALIAANGGWRDAASAPGLGVECSLKDVLSVPKLPPEKLERTVIVYVHACICMHTEYVFIYIHSCIYRSLDTQHRLLAIHLAIVCGFDGFFADNKKPSTIQIHVCKANTPLLVLLRLSYCM